MKGRITAAWRVLRGEWVAHAPVRPVAPTYSMSSNNSGTTTNIVWDYS